MKCRQPWNLTTLPGVGRKTANVVLGALSRKQAIAVDTHVLRVSNPGLALHILKILIKVEERTYEADTRDNRWTEFNLAMILHGRETCAARKPGCGACVLYDECGWTEKDKGGNLDVWQE